MSHLNTQKEKFNHQNLFSTDKYFTNFKPREI